MATLEDTLTTYQGFYAQSLADPERFWAKQAERIDWNKPFKKVLEYTKPPFRTWFAGGAHTTTHLVMVYVVGEDGRVTSMRAYWSDADMSVS